MSALLCRLFGHQKPYIRKKLREFTSKGERYIYYPTADRDSQGRPLAWPECRRCGHMLYWVDVDEVR